MNPYSMLSPTTQTPAVSGAPQRRELGLDEMISSGAYRWVRTVEGWLAQLSRH